MVQPVVLLMGPTAAGKSDLALALAESLGGEIVSVDSAQVYRGLDIGSAKPDAATRARVPHHLIDIADPAEAYSAARFREDAAAAIGAIRARGRLPILAGGTMLYFRALQQGLAGLPRADAALRAELEREAAREGWPALHARLAAVDPETAAKLHPNDSQRIQRALEVHRLSGRPMSALQREAPGGGLEGAVVKLAVSPPERAELHARIARRFRLMLEQGLLDEVRRLKARGDLHRELPSMRAVGYQELWRHLDGEWDLATATERAIAATRQLAKRQLTWLRSEPALGDWLDPADPGVTARAEERIRSAAVEGSQ